MASWSYRVANLLTDEILDEFDIPGASFDDRIGQPGEFNGTIALTNQRLGNRVRNVFRPSGVTKPPPRALHVYRDGRFWTGPYITWHTQPNWNDKGRVFFSINAAGLGSYPMHRQIRTDLSFENVDQLKIARDLVEHMQVLRPENNLNIQVGDEMSGRLRDRTYYGAETAWYFDRIAELSAVIDGFEFRFTALGEDRIRHFLTGYPKLGRSNPEIVLAMPGNIGPGSVDYDASVTATSFLGRGDALTDPLDEERTIPLLSDVVVREDLLVDGWPLLDRTDDYQGVVIKETLDEHTEHQAQQYGGEIEIPALTVQLPEDNSLTFGNLGDPVRIIIRNEFWPRDADGVPTFTRTDRIVGMRVTPSGLAAGDRVDLILEGDAA